MSFLNFITQGASLAAKYLPAIIGALTTESSKNVLSPDPLEFEEIRWGYDKKEKKVKVANVGQTEKGVHFSRTDKETGIYTELYHPLGQLDSYDATQDISDYADGNIAMSQAEIGSDSPVGVGLPKQSRFFAYIPQMIGAKLVLTGQISFERTQNGFLLKMPFVFSKCNLTISDKRGQSFSLSGEAQKETDLNENTNDNYHQCILDLPSGADPNYPFNSMSLEILMPVDTYKGITAERRKLNRKINLNEIYKLEWLNSSKS